MQRPSVAAFLACAAIALSSTVASSAHAQPEETSSAPRRAIALAIDGPAEESRLLEETIRELVTRLELQVTKKGGEAHAGILARADVAPAGAGGTRVVVRSAGGNVLVDRVIEHDANVAIEREQIALAVRGAAEAELLADQEREAKRPPPPAPPPAVDPIAAATREAPAAVHPSSSSGFALDLGTYAGGGPIANDAAAVVRVGAGASLAWRRSVRPSIGLSALYALPFETGDQTLSAHARLVSLRALPAVQVVHARSVVVDAGAGAGCDIFTVEPGSNVLPASTLGARTMRVDPILSAAVTLRFAITADVSLAVVAVVDADLASRRYVFDEPGARSDVLSPWRVRPMLLAGLSFTALGDGLFGSRTR